MADKNRFASAELVGGVKKISDNLIFDNTGRATINYSQGQIVGITLKSTTYTYALRFLNESQTLVYLIDAYTNDRIEVSATISADIYLITPTSL